MTYRIAVAGAGNAATTQGDSVRELDDAEIVAVSSRTAASRERYAEAYDCEAHPDTETMLDAADPDVLFVCTPSGAHLDPTRAAAERGVHVLCEKPLEITTERIDRMIDACEAGGVRLGGIFQNRFYPAIGAVQEAASAGRFGDLSVVTGTVPWWRDDDYYRGAWQGTRDLDGGGALMNQSSHTVDLVQWLAASAIDEEGNPVEEVLAYTGRRAHDDAIMEVEDTAVACLRFSDGSLGQLLATTAAYPGEDREVRIAGRDGTATVEGEEIATWAFRDGDEDVPDPTGDLSPTARNVREFLDAIEDDEPFVLDAEESRKAVAVVEAIYESAERGEPVSPS